MKHLILFLSFFLFIWGVQAQKVNQKSVLMTIADEKVSTQEFMDVFTKNNIQNEVIDKKSLEEYLDLYINFKLKVKEAENLQLDTNKAFIQELDGYRKQLAKPYFTDESVSEALLQEAWQRKQQDIRASHILLMLDKNAAPKDTLEVYNRIMKIRERAIRGEDFGALAAETSEDPSAKDREAIPNQRSFRPGNKGDLGYFSVFDMVYPFETGAYTTPVGEISMPLRSEFGYHLIKVTEKTPASGLTEAAHIYISVNPDAEGAEIAEKAEKAQFIYEKIQAGMKFEEAVKEYSDDRGSATRDGLLTKFAVNRIVPEFVAAIKKMEPGQISAPVRTVYGFHIIKLIGSEKPGTFEEEAPKLKEKLAKDSRSQKSEDAVITQIKADAKFKSNVENLNTFTAGLDSTLAAGKFDATPYQNSSTPLFQLGKQKFTVKDFANYIASKQAVQQKTTSEAYALKLYQDFVKESCLKYEDSQLEKKHPEFAALMKEYHDGILLFDLMDKKVWTKAIKDTVGLAAFHEAHKMDYIWNERAEAQIFTITNKAETAQVAQILSQISDLTTVRSRFESDSLKSVRIQPGKFEKNDNKYIDLCDWKSGLYGPFEADADKATIYVQILNILPSQPKALDEAKGLITSDYQNYLEKEWVKELRAKYTVDVNTKNFELLKAQYPQ